MIGSLRRPLSYRNHPVVGPEARASLTLPLSTKGKDTSKDHETSVFQRRATSTPWRWWRRRRRTLCGSPGRPLLWMLLGGVLRELPVLLLLDLPLSPSRINCFLPRLYIPYKQIESSLSILSWRFRSQVEFAQLGRIGARRRGSAFVVASSTPTGSMLQLAILLLTIVAAVSSLPPKGLYRPLIHC